MFMDSTLTQISTPFSLKHNPPFNKKHNFLSTSLACLSSRIHNKSLFNSNWKLEGSSRQIRAQDDDVVLDKSAFEAERLRLDAQARESMVKTSKREMETSTEDDSKAWKWVIWKRVWDLMEAQNFAKNPRLVHHQIPNLVVIPQSMIK